MKPAATHPRIMLGLLGTAAVLVLLVTPMLGPDVIPLGALFGRGDPAEIRILWQLRIPRVFTAWLAGSALALCGMTFQALFRNPLATPFTLGASSGAALGASIAIRFGAATVLFGLPLQAAGAFAGALLTVALVYGLTRLKGGFSTATLLLAGLAVSFFFSSLILFIQYLAGVEHTFRIVRWLMGSVAVTDYGPPLMLLLIAVGGLAVLTAHVRELNLLAAGEEIALSRGAEVDRIKKWLFLAVSLMVGGVVAVCGPIGFVGMMAPHICRLLVGPHHRYLLPASALFGGAFLALCDLGARTLIAPADMPVGVWTALIGGPFFIVLLLTRAVQHEM